MRCVVDALRSCCHACLQSSSEDESSEEEQKVVKSKPAKAAKAFKSKDKAGKKVGTKVISFGAGGCPYKSSSLLPIKLMETQASQTRFSVLQILDFVPGGTAVSPIVASRLRLCSAGPSSQTSTEARVEQ